MTWNILFSFKVQMKKKSRVTVTYYAWKRLILFFVDSKRGATGAFGGLTLPTKL